MKISYASMEQVDYLTQHDRHIPEEVMRRKVELGEVLLAWEGEQPVGWMRFHFMWDTVPFMSMLFVEEPYRAQGYGRALIDFWEGEMRAQGYAHVLTSTMSNESAQHLYRKLGYKDCGGMIMPEEPMELFLVKEFGKGGVDGLISG